jgi:hypothetical protein
VAVRLPRHHVKRHQSCVRSHVLRPSRLLELPFVYSIGAFHRLFHSVFVELVRDVSLCNLSWISGNGGTHRWCPRHAALQYIC